jgi:hypothetical protein
MLGDLFEQENYSFILESFKKFIKFLNKNQPLSKMWIIPANLVDLTTKATTTSTISTDTSEKAQKISIMWETIH